MDISCDWEARLFTTHIWTGLGAFALLLSIAAVGVGPVGANPPGAQAPASASDSLQTRPQPHDLSTPIEHEQWLHRIDMAGVEVRNSKGSFLVAIARLGKGERDRRLNRLRLKYVAEIFEGRQFGVQLIGAEGGAVPQLGRIEFYVCNELFSVLTFQRGKAVAIQHRP